MRRPWRDTQVVVVLAAGMLLRPVHAQTVTTFTSLQAWQAAVTQSWQFSTNFQSVTRDTYFQTETVSFGPFSLQQIGTDPTFGFFQNFIDVPPLQFTDNSGVTNAALFTKYGINTVEMTFSSPVFAWGANFYGAQTGELWNLVLTATGGGVVATVPVTVDTGFFGFVLSPAQGLNGVTFESQIQNPDPTVGQGAGLESITGAYIFIPTLVPSSQIAITASGLVYSRVTQTFNGTVTVKNVTSGTIEGPFQIVCGALPSGVTLANALGTYQGNPYVTMNVTSLAARQSATVNVQFSDPSNVLINVSPAVYSGGF
jgi:hypothetical protein